ncbi:MAG: hypothetical protein KJ915_08670 [Candidatus Omnitrophica bacterium]|nr:hypothetical protein [Candidatus Omnitrophota bacterium]
MYYDTKLKHEKHAWLIAHGSWSKAKDQKRAGKGYLVTKPVSVMLMVMVKNKF